MTKIKMIIASVAMVILIIVRIMTVKIWASVPHAACDK